ncbi:MAG: sulfatase-like hydrolase/transferase [Rubripirellula sp.]
MVRWTPIFLCVIAATLIGLSRSGRAQDSDERPNVLLIVGDDIGFGDLGMFGAITKTPTLNRLANQGINFTNFHASPVCSVTRAMLLTGNDSIEVGLGTFDFSVYPPAKGKPGYETYLTQSTATIAELLQDAGYRTCMVGKWHLGGTHHGGQGPHEWGFERSYAIHSGASNHWNQGVFHVNMHDPEVAAMVKEGKIPDEQFYENGKEVERPIGVYSDDLYTSKLLEYLQQGREDGKPFFAYVAYTTAHAPLQAPDFLIDKYYEHYLNVGYEGLKRERFKAQKKHGLIPPDARYPTYSSNPLISAWSNLSQKEKQREARSMATYSAMIESQDYHIGMVLNYLRETGELDNTLIVYMSDNGPEGQSTKGELADPSFAEWIRASFNQEISHIGRGDSFAFIGTDWANASTGGLQWWKWFIGEGGIRVPLLIIPPKDTTSSREGQFTNEFASVKDVPMTILDYAGVEHPMREFRGRKLTSPSGVSMRSFIEGQSERPRNEEQWVAFELFGNCYVVAGDFKAMLVRTGMYGDGRWHLYDIKNDPGETQPLEEDMPDKLRELMTIYEEHAEKTGIVPVAKNWNPWHGFVDDAESN